MKIPRDQKLLRYSNHPVWHQQSFHGQNHLYHNSSHILTFGLQWQVEVYLVYLGMQGQVDGVLGPGGCSGQVEVYLGMQGQVEVYLGDGRWQVDLVYLGDAVAGGGVPGGCSGRWRCTWCTWGMQGQVEVYLSVPGDGRWQVDLVYLGDAGAGGCVPGGCSGRWRCTWGDAVAGWRCTLGDAGAGGGVPGGCSGRWRCTWGMQWQVEVYLG